MFQLISGRTTKEGVSREIGKTSHEFLESVGVVFMNEEDMEKIGVSEEKNVKVKTSHGETVVKCKKGRLEKGLVFMPYGPWVNMVLDVDTFGTGMPSGKGVKVEISPTKEEVYDVEKILERVRE